MASAWTGTCRTTCLLHFASSSPPRSSILPHGLDGLRKTQMRMQNQKPKKLRRKKRSVVAVALVDPWAPTMAVDSQSLASQLFAISLLPYLVFLYFMTKSSTAPKLTLFGFYFLLAFVGATIPAGIYAKIHYGTSLSNVDWLHGSAESLLTLTNLFIVLGLRKQLREMSSEKFSPTATTTKVNRVDTGEKQASK
eukprot:TRINITY_DN1864_c0_g1_i1.p1 TRINITY_DN1864_c0_g1~~TRINITY_DN1864_c0_g1_i1.p1  ORF type:complete len:194 (-),score=21.69 TRINITY_DN1864_c0_g1_i1:280-861(-)